MSLSSTLHRSLRTAWPLSPRFQRQHERKACAVVAQLYFIERGLSIRGLIDEASLGGFRFRPAQSFILQRNHDPVRVTVFDRDLLATLVNTSPMGYGLKLTSMLSTAELEEIVGPDALQPSIQA